MGRRAGLGQYNATRSEWLYAYRRARIRKKSGLKPCHLKGGIQWKAQLIIYHDREYDLLAYPKANTRERLTMQRISESIFSELII